MNHDIPGRKPPRAAPLQPDRPLQQSDHESSSVESSDKAKAKADAKAAHKHRVQSDTAVENTSDYD